MISHDDDSRDFRVKLHRRILMAQKLLATVSKDGKIIAFAQGVALTLFKSHEADSPVSSFCNLQEKNSHHTHHYRYRSGGAEWHGMPYSPSNQHHPNIH